MNDLAREAFEQWYLREIDGDPEELATEVDGEYFFHVPRTAWRAWQATPEPDHIGGANKKADEPTGQLLACDTCDSQTDDPWHYSTPTNRHMHACDVCWPEVQLIMLAEAKQGLLSRRGVPPEDMAAAIQLEDEA